MRLSARTVTNFEDEDGVLRLIHTIIDYEWRHDACVDRNSAAAPPTDLPESARQEIQSVDRGIYSSDHFRRIFRGINCDEIEDVLEV